MCCVCVCLFHPCGARVMHVRACGEKVLFVFFCDLARCEVMAADQVQRHAAAHILDAGLHAPNPLLAKLARIGVNGTHPSNAERDLFRLARREGFTLATDFYFVDIEVHDPNAPGFTRHEQHPMLLPHELVGEMHQRGVLSRIMFPAGLASLQSWWDFVAAEEWAVNYPIAADLRRKTIPLGFFGDDAPYVKSDTLLMMGFSSILSDRRAWMSRHLSTVLPHQYKLQRRTLRQLMAVLTWSFTALASGVHPSNDHLGNPWSAADPRSALAGREIAGGFRGALVEFRGDWKWQCQVFQLPAWGAVHCCHQCAAGRRRPWLYTDVRDRPSWRLRPLTNELFVRARQGPNQCPLMRAPGFHMAMIRCCSMHTINLGFGASVNGNVLVDLITATTLYGPDDMSLDLKLRAVHADLKRWCRVNGASCSQPMLTTRKLHMGPNVYPELDAKAYNSRVITAYLAEMCAVACLTDHSEYALLRSGCCWGLATLYDLVERAPLQMSPQQAVAAERAGMISIQCYARLAQASLQIRRARWALKPKVHKLHHLLRQMARDRPTPRFCAVCTR